jgi:hypothetical protein
MVEKMTKIIRFYSLLELTSPHVLVDADYIREHFKNPSFPCVLLIRNNQWNDFGYVTHFGAFFVDQQRTVDMGTVIIIDSNIKPELFENKTELAETFIEVDKTRHFSGGYKMKYYETLKNELSEYKMAVLESLNDVEHHGYGPEFFANKKGPLEDAYRQSIKRERVVLDASSEYFANALSMIEQLEQMRDVAKTQTNSTQRQFMLNMLYGATIAVLESYLSDAAKINITKNDECLVKFVNNWRPDNSRKYSLSELQIGNDRTLKEFSKQEVKKILNNIIFHKLDTVYQLYNIIGIKLANINQFAKPIEKRHDIFHRNGKTVEGVDVTVSSQELMQLLMDVKAFIKGTEETMRKLL